MFRRGCKFALWWLPALGPIACQPECPPVVLDARGVVPAANYDALAKVLEASVRKNGLANADALKRRSATLDAQLRLLAVTGPTATPALFPTEEHAIAYWYNAHAAWSMKLLLVEQCPRKIRKAPFEGRPFPLDGRMMTLGQINQVLVKDHDFRTAVAVPGVTTQHARLPTVPFAAGDVRQRIAERFADFVDDPMRFVIEVRRRRILVPPVLWQFRRQLIDAFNTGYGTEGANLTTALLPHLTGSPRRRLQDAVGYRAVEAPSEEQLAHTEGR